MRVRIVPLRPTYCSEKRVKFCSVRIPFSTVLFSEMTSSLEQPHALLDSQKTEFYQGIKRIPIEERAILNVQGALRCDSA